MDAITANPDIDINNCEAEIISYADNTHYLAALLTQQGEQELLKDGNGKPLRFVGLHQAKEWFRLQGFERATLRMETPYDEFIGQPAGPAMMPISLDAESRN